jgi:hypothetical protein
VKGVALALGVLAGAAGLAALAASGCATAPAPLHVEPQVIDYEPDGGWANYRPERRQYEADPVRASTGVDRTLSPAAPIGLY